MATISIDPRQNRDGNSPLTPNQRNMIQQAADEAERMAEAGWHAFARMWNQSGGLITRRNRRRDAWNADRRIVRWFGNDHLSTYQMDKTKDRMWKIREEFMQTIRFDVIQHQTGHRSYLCQRDANRAAYCSPGTPIKLCPHWFNITNVRTRAGVIIHELVHKNGHVHHRNATTLPLAENLARDHVYSARRNPSNFQGFCLEF